MSEVVFRGVTKRFGQVVALAEVDLQVADGELLVCVGSSGCGKSTLLRLVAGLEQPDAGSLSIGGRSVDGIPPRGRNVAMVFQDYALYPHMTVRQNLAFPLKMHGLATAEIQRRIQWAAAHLDLADLLERLPKQLSGGQRQRVAMGRALVREPAVFLLDEPLSNLDAKLRVQVRADIAELQAQLGTTMMYVTHDQVEAMTLGHRVAVFHQGRLQQAATPQELYYHPANTFVAGFIGNPPMNLLPVQAAEFDRGCLHLRIAGQNLALPAASATSCPATLGIRPEALCLCESGGADSLAGTLENIEYLGHETLLYLKLTGDFPVRLIARIKGMQNFVKNERVSVVIGQAALQWFDDKGIAIG